jgi:hypothetical protein
MELTIAMGMDWVRVAQDSAGCCRVGDEHSISIRIRELFDKLRRLKGCAMP